MPRIKKQGLDYFPLNTDFIHDRLVRRIMKREGDAALAVLIEAFSYIYAGEGYYVHADSLFYEDLSANMYEKTADDVKRIIALAAEYGIFDATLFSEHGVLTSVDIQHQYLFSTKRRSASKIDPAYNLMPEAEDCSAEASDTDACEEEASAPIRESVTNTVQNVTLKPQNATFIPHSIAQHSIAENSKEYPPLGSPTGGRGGEGEEEIPVSRRSAPRKTWTDEEISRLTPPADGLQRNLDGLIYNLRQFRVPPPEQYAIICKSNFGVIGHPMWKGFGTLRESNGKIRQPGHYLLSLCNRT